MRNLLLSLFLSISTTTYAQSSFEDMRNMYCAIDVEAKIQQKTETEGRMMKNL